MLVHVQHQCAGGGGSRRRSVGNGGGGGGKRSRLAFQSCHLFPVGTSQYGLNLERSCDRLLIIASDGHLDVQIRIAVVLIQVGCHIPVKQAGLGRGIEPDIVKDAS